MSDVNEKSVVYITKLTHTDDGTFKYVDDKSRQFREAYREIKLEAEAAEVEVLFAEIQDLGANGHLSRVYRLISSDEALEFKSVKCDFMPAVVVNKVKDLLYQHPGYQQLIAAGKRVINEEGVAKIGDKAVSQQIVGSFMPPSLSLPATWSSDKRLSEVTEFVRQNGRAVVKPLRLNGARGLLFISETDVSTIDHIARDGEPYVLQQFIETNKGIPGFIEGRHDLRIFICRGKMIAGALRQPEAGGLVSNTAQGGTIQFFGLEELPKGAVEYCKKVLDILHLPVYSFVSLDFFFGNGRWYLIEINDQPGIPARYQNKRVATTLQRSLVALYKDGLLT